MTATPTAWADRTEERRRAARGCGLIAAVPLVVAVAVVVGVTLGVAFSWLVGLIVGPVVGAGVGAWWVSRRRATAVARLVELFGARPADEAEFPRFVNLVEGLCITSGVEEPELLVIDEDHPNLMTSGAPGEAVIVATTGLLTLLNRVELEGVLAEAICRIRAHDSDLATQAAVFQCGPLLRSGPTFTERPMWMVSPLATFRARQLAEVFEVHRDFLADQAAISMTRYPPALEAALIKMIDAGTVIPDCPWGAAHLWMCEPLTAAPDGTVEDDLNQAFAHRTPITHRIDLLAEL